MSLRAMRTYLQSVRQASVAGLSQVMGCEADMVRQMLLHWVRRGCVRCIEKKPLCGSACTRCPAAATEWYEWVQV